jgi:hypothetical protein
MSQTQLHKENSRRLQSSHHTCHAFDGVAGFLVANVGSCKRTGDCNIDSKTFSFSPFLERDISRSAASGVTKNAFLSQELVKA